MSVRKYLNKFCENCCDTNGGPCDKDMDCGVKKALALLDSKCECNFRDEQPTEGTLVPNSRFHFCPTCGKQIEEVK